MTTRADVTVQQQRDRVPRGPVYAFAAFLLVLLTAGACVTWISERGVRVQIGRESAAVPVLPREIESIDLSLFSAHLLSNGNWTARRRSLESYAWVDRSRNTVTIPIDRAMQMIVERGRVE